jgi:hypothetical protein
VVVGGFYSVVFFFRDRISSEAENWEAEHEAVVVGLLWGARHNLHIPPPYLCATRDCEEVALQQASFSRQGMVN